MPAKNTVKTYAENTYFHIYNRGVEKRMIFYDKADYSKFLDLLRIYVTPVDILHRQQPLLRPHILNNNLSEDLDLLAYCLMPNHFHLLVYQKTKDAVTKLMRQVITSFVMYFNKRYERVGSLFQGIFKASLVKTDEHLLHLSRYIHLNPLDRGTSLDDYKWSSYHDYLGKRNSDFVNTKIISDYFSKTNSDNTYQRFVEDYQQALDLPPELTIEEQ